MTAPAVAATTETPALPAGATGRVATAASRWRARLSRLVPYAVAGACLFFVLRRYSIDAIAAEMARGDVLPTIPIATVTFVVTLILVAAADTMVVQRHFPAIEYFAVLRAKAASVLLQLVHYAAGQGAYGAWIGRTTGCSIGWAGGVTLYIVAAELCSICLLVSLVLAAFSPAVPSALGVWVASIAAVLVFFIVMAPFNHTPADRVVAFRPWTRGNRTRGLAQLGVRIVQHGASATGTWLAARAFGLDIPFDVAITFLPVIAVVGALPVNVGGIGAVQAAWLMMEPWAPGEQILAFSFVWQLVTSVVLVARGAPFVQRIVGEIRAGAPRADVA